MKIAIVGGRGFIGSPLARFLRKKHIVRIWDLPEVDIRKKRTIKNALQHFCPDVVVNLAAVLGDMYAKNVTEIFETNFYGNMNLIDATISKGIKRFIFASSLTVHGENDKKKPLSLTSPFLPKHPYSASKAAAEISLMQYARVHEMAIVSIRPVSVIGKGTYMNHAPMDFTRTALRGETIHLYGDGGHEREWLWIDDVVESFARAIEASAKIQSGYYPVFVSGNRISMRALAERCVSRIGGTLSITDKTAQAFTLTCDMRDSRKFLGNWRPRFSIDAIINETTRFLKA